MAKKFNDQKKHNDVISASVDWNPMARFMNALLNAEVTGLDAVFSLNSVAIANKFAVMPVDIRVVSIGLVGTLNGGVGLYKAEEVELDKTVDPWEWVPRTGYHMKWDTEELGNSTADLLVVDDLMEINFAEGIEEGTIAYAMKVQRLTGDKSNTDAQYQWLFAVAGAGGEYEGPFKVTYNSDTDRFIIGDLRSTMDYHSDIIISGTSTVEKTVREFLDRSGNTNGYIYYSITGQTFSPFFNVTLNISNGGSIPAQTDSIAQVLLARYFYDGTSMTTLRQLQFGNIVFDGRW